MCQLVQDSFRSAVQHTENCWEFCANLGKTWQFGSVSSQPGGKVHLLIGVQN
jgi:hypothetical protein